jgi:hypothetical protein
MMRETLASTQSAQPAERPFPWFCPRCRRQEVRRTTIHYQCQRLHEGRSLTLTLTDLVVPQCGHCGQLVFDYVAEEQLNRAYQEQVRQILANGEAVSNTEGSATA